MSLCVHDICGAVEGDLVGGNQGASADPDNLTLKHLSLQIAVKAGRVAIEINLLADVAFELVDGATLGGKSRTRKGAKQQPQQPMGIPMALPIGPYRGKRPSLFHRPMVPPRRSKEQSAPSPGSSGQHIKAGSKKMHRPRPLRGPNRRRGRVPKQPKHRTSVLPRPPRSLDKRVNPGAAGRCVRHSKSVR